MDFSICKNLYWNTFQKEYRNKTLIFFIFITLIVIFAVNGILDFFGQFVAEGMFANADLSNKKLIVLYSIVNTWNFFLASFIGMSCIRSDYEGGILDQILSFPIRRSEYLISRLFGSWTLVCAYYLFSILGAMAIFSFSSGGVSLDANFIYAFGVNCFASLGAMVLAIFVSLFISKTKGLILLFIIFILFHSSGIYYSLNSFSDVLKNPGIMNIFGTLVYFLLPRIGVMGTISSKLLINEAIPYNLFYEFTHFTLTTFGLSAFLIWVFNRKETR